MLRVTKYYASKAIPVHSHPDMPIIRALETMSEQDIGSLVIMEHANYGHGDVPGNHPALARQPWRHWRQHASQHHGRRTGQCIANTSADEVQRLMLESTRATSRSWMARRCWV